MTQFPNYSVPPGLISLMALKHPKEGVEATLHSLCAFPRPQSFSGHVTPPFSLELCGEACMGTLHQIAFPQMPICLGPRKVTCIFVDIVS